MQVKSDTSEREGLTRILISHRENNFWTYYFAIVIDKILIYGNSNTKRTNFLKNIEHK